MKKDIYLIDIKNWLKYNGSLKKGHKCIMLSTRFLDDSKIRNLSSGGKLLYLGLLLRCGDLTSNLIECTHDLLQTFAGGRGHDVLKLLDQLESFQLLTYTKVITNRIEKNRKEEKVIEKNIITTEASDPKNPDAENQLNFEPEKKSYPHRPNKVQSRGCIDEFALDETCKSRLENVTTRAQKAWLVAYPNADWICFEIRKAHAWCETNSHKAPKDFGRFMNSWLNKAFENYRKGLNSKYKTNAQRNSDALQEMKERVERGEL